MYHLLLVAIFAIAPLNLYAAQHHKLNPKVESWLQRRTEKQLEWELMTAACDHDCEASKKIIQELLDKGISIDCRRDTPLISDGATPLMLAALWQNIPTMQLLLDHGACTNLEDAKGQDLYHYAASGGSKSLHFLMQYTAKKASLSFQALFAEFTSIAQDPTHVVFAYTYKPTQKQLNQGLCSAVLYSQVDHIQFFLTQGADANNLDNSSGFTPLIYAIRECYIAENLQKAQEVSLEVIKILLQHGADLSCKDKAGKTIDDHREDMFSLSFPGMAEIHPIGVKILQIFEEHKKQLAAKYNQEHEEEKE